MKSKQLANVLIKIIGLYVCLCAIPGVVSGIGAILEWVLKTPKWDDFMGELLAGAAGAIVQASAGIVLIVKSRSLAAYWFKNDEE